jgi:hypothetical protein
MWASPPVRWAPGIGKSHTAVIEREPANPLGTTEPSIAPPFDSNYSLVSIGYPVGVQTYYGGLTFKYDDPNTLLIAGAAGSPVGRIYQIAVNRDTNGHIIGFNGSATLYPGTGSTIGQYNDAGVAFGPANVLFVRRYPANELEQSKVGSLAPDKVINLTALGVTGGGGSIGFVPPGFPGAGSMKLVSWGGGGWYHCEFAPDSNGTFNITSASLRATIGGPEGIAFLPPDSPVFQPNSVLIVQYGYSKVVAAPLDANGDPIMAQSQDFIRNLPQASGACIDPVTGDFLLTPGVDQAKSYASAASQHRHQLRRALRGNGFPELTIHSTQIAQHSRPMALMPTPLVAVRPTEEGSTPRPTATTRPPIVGRRSRA